MTFNISPKETLQKADYTNNFQNHVEQTKLRDYSVAEAKARDFEESQAAKKEREIIERYLKGYFSDETIRLTAFQIVGKLLFFIVVMPPVFLVLTVPKWLYQQIVEKGETLLDNVEKRAAALIRPVINWVVTESNRLSEMVGMRGKQISALFTKGGQLFSKLVERTLLRFSEKGSEIGSAVKQAAASLLSLLQNIGQKAVRPFQEAFESTKAFLTNLRSQIAPSPGTSSKVEEIQERLKALIDKLAQLPKALREDGKEILEGAKAIADMGVSFVYAAAQVVTNIIIPFVPTFSSPLLAASKEKMNLAANVAKLLLHSAQMQINRFQGFLVLKYQEASTLLGNLLLPFFARGQQWGKQAFQQVLNSAKRAISQIKKRSCSFFAKMQEKWKRYITTLQEQAKKKRDQLAAFFSSLKERSKKRAQEWADAIQRRKRGFFQFILMLQEKGAFFVSQFLFAISALFLIFRIFLKITFQRAIFLSRKI